MNKQQFRVGDIFTVLPVKKLSLPNKPYVPDAEIISPDGTTPYIAAISKNNGITGYSQYEPNNDGDCITLSTTADSSNTVFYQPDPFIGRQQIAALRRQDGNRMGRHAGMFICSIIKKLTCGFNYANKLTIGHLANCIIELPSSIQYRPDWAAIERLSLSLSSAEEWEDIMSKIDTSQWQEFELCTLFSAENGDIDLQQKDINERGNIVITSGVNNNGILGKTDIKAKLMPEDTLTVDMFGNVFYRDFQYKMVTHARVFSLLPIDFSMNKEIGLFLASCMSHFTRIFDYNNMCSWNKIKNEKILLPAIEEDVPDWEYMAERIQEMEAERIQEMEAERIQEMEAYLAASGFDNIELTDAEKEALSTFDALLPSDPQRFKSFPLHTLFDKIATRKLPYKAGDLAKEPFEDSVPVLTASNENQGLTRHIVRTELKDDDILSNKIVIIANGDCTAFYQSDEFAVLQDAYALEYLDGELDMETALYLTGCLQKLIKTSFNWNNKAGWNKIKDLELLLPVTDEGDIDYEYIHHFEGGVIKETISRVNSMRMREQSIAREIVNS